MLSEALEDVDIAFRQIEFANKVLAYCELEKLDPSDFDTDHLVQLDNGSLHFPSGHFSEFSDVVRSAMVSVSLAFGASALALDKAYEVAKIKSDPESNDDTVKIRTLVYMVRCAYAHGIADPQWEVRRQYARSLEFELAGERISIDLAALNDQVFNFDHLDGHQNWFRIRDAALGALGVQGEF